MRWWRAGDARLRRPSSSGVRRVVRYGLGVLAVAVVMSLMSHDLWLLVLLVVGSASSALGYSASALSVLGRVRSCDIGGDAGVRAATVSVAERCGPEAVTAAKGLVEESTRDRWLVALAHDRLDCIVVRGHGSSRMFVGVLMVGAVFAAGVGGVTQHRGWSVTMVVAASVAVGLRAASAARTSVGGRVLASLAVSDAAVSEVALRRVSLGVSEESVLRRVRACAGTHVAALVLASTAGSGLPW